MGKERKDLARNSMEQLISSCSLCDIVDKPFLKNNAYHWLPPRVKTLIIGESPPPGVKDNMFYNFRVFDRFRLSMKFILGVKNDEDVIRSLKRSLIFVTAAIKCRPYSRKDLKCMRKNCISILEEELKLLKPNKVLAMGRTASISVAEILGLHPPSTLDRIFEAKVPNMKVIFAPHPNFIFRFKRNLVPKIRDRIVS